MTRSLPACRPLAAVVLGMAMTALAACGAEAPAPDTNAPMDAEAPAPDTNAPAMDAEAPAEAAVEVEPAAPAAADLSALATGDVVLVDRTQMADEACHAMGNVIMGNCATQDDVDAVLATMGIASPILIDRNQMAEAPCHVMSGVVMGACTAEEAAALVDEVRAGR